MARTRSSSSATGAGSPTRWPGGHAAVGPHRVEDPQVDRVHVERRGELVHLRLVGEGDLHGAEAAHRAARRVVGVDDVGVDARVGDLVGPAARSSAALAHTAVELDA